MRKMIATAFLLAIGATACAATVVVEAGEDEAAGGREPYEDDSQPKVGSCIPCVGLACGLCPQSPEHVTFVCYEGMPPPGSGTCYETGDLFADDRGEPYTCSLCG